jgi:hypothetical protein
MQIYMLIAGRNNKNEFDSQIESSANKAMFSSSLLDIIGGVKYFCKLFIAIACVGVCM